MAGPPQLAITLPPFFKGLDFSSFSKGKETHMENSKRAIPAGITTEHGLLYQDGKMVGLPRADALARQNGFLYAERFVKYLEERKIRR